MPLHDVIYFVSPLSASDNSSGSESDDNNYDEESSINNDTKVSVVGHEV